jgi:hypothetical protein
MFNLFDNDEQADQPAAIFQFESGSLCPVCGLQHADQWQCDPTIPNPWGSTDEE